MGILEKLYGAMFGSGAKRGGPVRMAEPSPHEASVAMLHGSIDEYGGLILQIIPIRNGFLIIEQLRYNHASRSGPKPNATPEVHCFKTLEELQTGLVTKLALHKINAQ